MGRGVLQKPSVKRTTVILDEDDSRYLRKQIKDGKVASIKSFMKESIRNHRNMSISDTKRSEQYPDANYQSPFQLVRRVFRGTCCCDGAMRNPDDLQWPGTCLTCFGVISRPTLENFLKRRELDELERTIIMDPELYHERRNRLLDSPASNRVWSNHICGCDGKETPDPRMTEHCTRCGGRLPATFL